MNRLVITAAFPFIPSDIHIAHIASTYLPADIINRMAAILGYDSVLVSATDVHGLWVKKELQDTNIEAEVLKSNYHERYKKIFDCLDIRFDTYERTDDSALRDLVYESLYNLREKGYIVQKETIIYSCGECLEYLPKRFRIGSSDVVTKTGKIKLSDSENNYMCAFCGSDQIIESIVNHWFLDIQKGKSIIEDGIDRQMQIHVKNYLNSLLCDGLSEWDFTRDNYYGITIPFNDEDQYIYLWYESLIGYLFLANDLGGNISFRHFLGKNIVYYHGIVWPILLREATHSYTVDFQISARGFLDLSATDIPLDIFELTHKFPVDYIRFYCAYRTPDTMNDFYFKEAEFVQVINSVLCRQVGGFLKRCRTILQNNNVSTVPKQGVLHELIYETIVLVRGHFEKLNPNQALTEVLRYIKQCGNIISTRELYKNPSLADLELICKMMAGVIILIKPFVPTIIESYNIFEDVTFSSVDDLDRLEGCNLKFSAETWRTIECVVS
ncbi:class I tRNA ligase family protein [Paenibacillus woosongensis]|uniref:methionine--tRNA ligase n=1 Tax=Paenibacillus woosongensis TaxID=307580 RepID=A0A7X3CMX9_9BACL|nr:class I tRNA ligase family protein [Paenibacillus woosongensis]MUG45299.1 class I tRNA ligase family protein [Paenibacillus woosongensis]